MAVPVERQRAVERAMTEWVKKLVDMSGRNRLLFYRTLKRGTLELTDADELNVDLLLSGRGVSLSSLFTATAAEPDRFENARRRARTIHAKAMEHFEERGIETLFLAVGMATWTTTSTAATPSAPVLLRPLAIDPKGAAQTDFELRLEGDWDVNHTLVHYLATEYSVEHDAGALLDSGKVPGLQIDRRLVVGTFAYTKLPMVRDIGGNVAALAEHDIIAAIAGDATARAALRSRRADSVTESAPDRTHPRDEYLILDADASQNYVINAALNGESLVVQGPPGTGKSQTIANLVATFVARGKRVLFVAEKRAAIDAVTKRLEGAGLADLVMDLHGGVRSRRQLAGDIQSSLDRIAQVPKHDQDDLHRGLESARSALVDHADAVHQIRDPWGISFHGLIQRLIDLGRGLDPPPVMPGPGDLDAIGEAAHREVIELLGEWGDLVRPALAIGSPWLSARIDSDDDVRRAHAIVGELVAGRVAEVGVLLDDALDDIAVPAPATLGDWRALIDLFATVAESEATLGSEGFSLDFDGLTAALAPGGESAVRRALAHVFNGGYRAAKKQLGELWRLDAKPDGPALLEATLHANEAVSTWRRFGGTGRPTYPANLATAAAGYEELTDRLTALGGFLPVEALTDRSVESLDAHLGRLLRDEQALQRMPHIRRIERRLDELGLRRFLDAARAGTLPVAQLPDTFDHAWSYAVRMAVTAADRRLATFDVDRHYRQLAEFRKSDRRHIDSTPPRVRRRAAEAAVGAMDEHPEQDQLVRAQAKRKRGHLPLRALFEQAPDVLTALRPCWVMSPLVVAQTLPARPVFDLVIFDEASQVLPADAVPALLRAPQAIVAGDEMQLPPTTFFGSEADYGEEPQDEDQIDLALTGGFESILQVLSSLLRSRMLTWHYRSEDERLIAFSNANIYDGALTTFPGSRSDSCLSYVGVPHHPGVPVDTRSNPDEVATVVDLMIEHARTHPDESLGVIAMGVYHADRVDAGLRKRLLDEDDPALDTFFDQHQPERPFVKNLERVQGDERDAIILSIGYGKTADGRLPYRFGPLLQEGGERRLNVAVSRARRRLTLVASFSHADMDPGRSSKRGVALLRRYLEYAASGGRELEGADTLRTLDPFEDDVKRRLTGAGLTVVPRFGVSDFRIDFAVPHPENRGQMLLAIETDGESYRTAATARDRDRLRQQVLERLGWRFHRIWATDWFRDPEAATRRALDAYSAAVNDRGPEVDRFPVVAVTPAEGAVEPAFTRTGPRPPGMGGGRPIDEYTPPQLIEFARWVASDGLLRTEAELIDEMIGELGYKRRGAKIVRSVTDAVRFALGEHAGEP